MTRKCVPMIHVPDVRATVDWYQGIGFEVIETYGDGGEGLSFAILSFGTSQVMFNSGGAASGKARREVDLYVYTDDVDGIYERLKDRVDMVEGPHGTFYGMREVIVRDLNRFWVTFGEPSVGDRLMAGVAEGNPEVVRVALSRGGWTPERLSAALGLAWGHASPNADIIRLLREAGAVAPPAIDVSMLRMYTGIYHSEKGPTVKIGLQDGGLVAFPDEAPPARLLPVNQTVFKTIDLPEGTLAFEIRGGVAMGLTFTQGAVQIHFNRVQDLPA